MGLGMPFQATCETARLRGAIPFNVHSCEIDACPPRRTSPGPPGDDFRDRREFGNISMRQYAYHPDCCTTAKLWFFARAACRANQDRS